MTYDRSYKMLRNIFMGLDILENCDHTLMTNRLWMVSWSENNHEIGV